MCRPSMLQLHHVAVLWCHLFLPPLLCDHLLCYFSPILEKERTFELIVTECPLHEICFKADGRYGNHSALSARGCMAKKDCRKVHSLTLRGTVYNMSYGCCDWPYCNSCPGLTGGSLHIIATLTTVAMMAGSL